MDSFKWNHFQFQVNELLSVGRLSLDEVAPVQDVTKEVFVPHINEVNQRFSQIYHMLRRAISLGYPWQKSQVERRQSIWMTNYLILLRRRDKKLSISTMMRLVSQKITLQRYRRMKSWISHLIQHKITWKRAFPPNQRDWRENTHWPVAKELFKFLQ